MKKYFLIWMGLYSVIAACKSDQHHDPASADSVKREVSQTDSSNHKLMQKLAGSGDMVKAEAPDALLEFEQGYALPRMDEGSAQSPVNIISSNVQPYGKQRGGLKFTGTINAVENLGHTIQIDFARGGVTLVNGKPYELKQLHFHTPSEHLVDGMTFPMEMHIVSKLNDSIKSEGSTFTVLGILFKFGRENKFLKEFLNAVPQEEGRDSLNPNKVKLADFFMDIPALERMSYYHYQGSLTTPPYTESVNWIVAKRIFEASEEQIDKIEKLEGNNARHVHALKDRKIEAE